MEESASPSKRTFIQPIFDRDEIHDKKIIVTLANKDSWYRGIGTVYVTRKNGLASYEVHLSFEESENSLLCVIFYLTERLAKMIARTPFQEYPFELLADGRPDWYDKIPKEGLIG